MKTQTKLSPDQIHRAKELLQFFEKIPEHQWGVGSLTDWVGRHCAIGHLVERERITKQSGSATSDAKFLDSILQEKYNSLITVNDYAYLNGRPGPKTCVVNAIKTIIEEQ